MATGPRALLCGGRRGRYRLPTASGGTSYQWSPATGLSPGTAATTVFTATQPGTYTCFLTATSASGCRATTSVTLTVTGMRRGNKNDKVSVCHNGNARCIAESAVPAHLNRGDQLGFCAGGTTAAAEAARRPEPVFEAAPNPIVDHTEPHFRAAATGPGCSTTPWAR